MAQKSGKEKKPVSATKNKIMPVKKTAVKKKETHAHAAHAQKLKPVIVPHEFRMNIRCRSCSFVDGYTAGEKVCHNCKNEIYEIDKI